MRRAVTESSFLAVWLLAPLVFALAARFAAGDGEGPRSTACAEPGPPAAPSPQPSESAGRSHEPEDTTAPGRDVLAAAPLVPGGPHRIVLADAESASPAWFEGARPDAVEPSGRAYFDRVVAEPRPGALPPSLASQVG
ncbi:MAG: hypothetical protein D6705_01780, partial [Deltaproteobacteria bacterium]